MRISVDNEQGMVKELFISTLYRAPPQNIQLTFCEVAIAKHQVENNSCNGQQRLICSLRILKYLVCPLEFTVASWDFSVPRLGTTSSAFYISKLLTPLPQLHNEMLCRWKNFDYNRAGCRYHSWDAIHCGTSFLE